MAAFSSRHALALLRIVAALLFIEHGTHKLLGVPAPIHGLPPLLSLEGVAGVLESVGGLFLLLGARTRAVAFVLAGEMAAAYWIAHAPRSLFPAVNGGDAAILFCFVFLYLVVAGPGSFSFDAAWRRWRDGAKDRRIAVAAEGGRA